ATPAISVLTPVWNGLPYIRECVESVFTQDFQDWEFIISDNGSTDGTRDYLDTLKDPRVRIFKQEKNLGIDGNLNFLFSQANAPVAYTLCADDYFYPGALTKTMYEWSVVPPNTAFIAFNWRETPKHSKLAEYSYKILSKKLDPENSQLAFFLFGNLPGNLSNVSCSVDLVKNSGGFNERLKQAGDFEIWARLSKSHHMVLSDAETAYVRRHENVATNYLNKKGELLAEHIAIYESLIDRLSSIRNRDKLVAYFNIEICSFHLRDALKFAIHGRFERMKTFAGTESSICWPTWKRLIYCLPFAVYERGRSRFVINMAQKMMKSA
ncbi:MAG: hypothetical protein C0490_03390, partial [Marivirga sp.]|nr:hypothetical protein [Marivirga sp.]